MKTEPVLSLTPKLLPPGASPKYLRALRQKQASAPAGAWHVLTVMLSVHIRHAVQAANKWAAALTILLLVLCFGTSSLPWGTASLLASTLIAVLWRGARMHNTEPPAGTPRLLHGAVMSGADATTAALLGLISNLMMQQMAPSAALPFLELWRGAVIGLPLFYVLRLYFNLKPEPEEMPSGVQKSEIEKLYRRVWWLGTLWMVSFIGVTACSVTDIPNYWPDRLRGFSIALFGLWWLLQKDCLGRFDKIRTIFRDPAKLELRRKYASLAKGLKRGEAFYPGYIAMEVMIHLVIALGLIDAVLPWLTGHSPAPSFMQAAAAIVSAAISILTWQAVKKSNRHAAHAIQKAMGNSGS